MNIERVARTVLGVAALCGLFVSAGCNGALTSNNSGAPPGGTPVPSVKAPGDWGKAMLAGGTVGVGMFPAKFTFDINATASCASDYVAFNTSLAGVSPTTAASRTGTFTGLDPGGHTVTISSPATTLVLTSSASSNTGLNFLVGGTTTTQATNLASAIIRNNTSNLGVTASSAAGVVTVTATNSGSEGNLISLATTLANFTWAGATLAGGVGTGNIVAFNNLYATQGSAGGLCNTDGPSTMWSYFTGTGTAVTSIVLSGDGSKVAFVENVGGTATLRLLKWKAGEGAGTGYPATPTTTLTAGQNWTTNCPAANSCISSIAFSGAAATDTRSSPFYVYKNNTDVLYAGDDSGRVHKFTGVFLGTPAEVTVGWPITVNAGAILTSAIYDSVSGNIFVGDSTGRLSYIREVGSTVGSACTLPCLGTPNLAVGTGGSIVDAPVVDGTTGKVIAFNGTETSANAGTVLQASTALVASAGSPFKIGGTTPGGSGIYSGAFDNTYITSAGGTGHMYVCGKDPANADRPSIYQLTLTSGTLTGVGTSVTGMTNGNSACSPVTEIFNSNAGGGTDWIFFSVGANLAPGGGNPLTACRSAAPGCVASIVVTGSPAWPGGATVFTAQPVATNAAGATSGIVVDNVSASAQTSNIYFSLGTNSTGTGPGLPSCNTTAGVGCAVKLTQSALN